MLLTVIAFIATLGILITFHELGHYAVARWCGVRILRFSVGFGRVLLRRIDSRGTEWAISAIPLGGYVKMLESGEGHPGSDPDGQPFDTLTVARRFAVVVAGPLANLLLAVLLYATIGVAGTQEPAPILAAPVAGSTAAQAGLLAGDRVIAVNQAPIQSWPQFRWEMLQQMSDGAQVELTVDQGGSTLTRTIDIAFTADPTREDPLRRLGLALLGPTPTVQSVVAGGAGAQAGIQSGDVVTAAGGDHDPDIAQFISIVQKHAEKPLELTIQRHDSSIRITVTPAPFTLESGEVVGRIGVQLGGDVPMVLVRHGLLDSLSRGVSRTGETAWFSLRMMGKMLMGELSLRNISGPVTIADYAGQTARMGWVAYVSFLALVSVSLGVLNLLPIPMLDGGHLLYYLIEIVRGSPPPARWIEIGQRAGFGLLACLMVLALFNDMVRIFG